MDEEWLSKLSNWQQRRGVKVIDVVVFGGISMLFVALGVGALLTPQNWPWQKILVLSLVEMVALGITTWYFVAKWLARPNLVTKHGTAIWTDGVEAITPELMDRALDHFIQGMSTEAKAFDISEVAMRKMLAHTGIEWSKRRVSLTTTMYELHDKAGIQHGYRLMIQWRGTVGESALIHELLHEVNEFIRLPRIEDEDGQVEFRMDDIQHKEAEWWGLDGALTPDF